jgi:PAS domain S-box-containing protein
VEEGNDGIVIIQDGLLKFANSKMVEITGFPKEEAIQRPFTDFVSPEYRELVIDRYKKRMSGEEIPNKYEIEILSKDGGKIPVEISASIIQYEGRPADMAIVRDITERKRAEEALRNALEESQQRRAEISALLEGSRTVLECREFEDAARAIFDSCKNLIGATAGYVALLSKDGNRNEILFLDSGGLPPRTACRSVPYRQSGVSQRLLQKRMGEAYAGRACRP